MEQSRMQTRLLSKSNSTTVDNVIHQFQGVPTEENLHCPRKDEGTSSRKRHRLSSAGIDSAIPSKRLRKGQVSREQVIKTTRAVIEKLLQKEPVSTTGQNIGSKSDDGNVQDCSNKIDSGDFESDYSTKDESDTTQESTGSEPEECSVSNEIEYVPDCSNDIESDDFESKNEPDTTLESTHILLDSKLSKTEDRFLKNEELPSLDFSGSFEADCCALPNDIQPDGFEPDHSTKDELDTTRESTEGIDKKAVNDAAEVLRNIGDKLNDEVKEGITKAAIEIVKKKAYKTYKKGMQSLLDISHQQPADLLCESERYQVVLVWLLTEKTIAEAKKAMASINDVSDVVENAAYFISEKFPSWLNAWM